MFSLPVIVVKSEASTQSPGDRSRGENALSVDAKTGLLATTLMVITSELAVPAKLEAPMVTLCSPTAVLRPTICPSLLILKPVGKPVAVNAVGPYKALTLPATGVATS